VGEVLHRELKSGCMGKGRGQPIVFLKREGKSVGEISNLDSSKDETREKKQRRIIKQGGDEPGVGGETERHISEKKSTWQRTGVDLRA